VPQEARKRIEGKFNRQSGNLAGDPALPFRGNRGKTFHAKSSGVEENQPPGRRKSRNSRRANSPLLQARLRELKREIRKREAPPAPRCPNYAIP